MVRRLGFLFLILLAPAGAQITVSFPARVSSKPLDGRVLLMISNDPSAEPRMQINDTPKSQIVFGTTVDGLAPGRAVTINGSAAGYPVRSLNDVPPGDYFVQAVLNIYQTFHRADGTTVKLAPDRGEGQHWNIAPGNLYSKPVKVRIDGHTKLGVSLTEVIPPIAPAADTKYIRHIRIQSDLLTKFWGTPMYLSAIVLVPEGFDEHPNAHYPMAIFHDHFVDGIGRLPHHAARSRTSSLTTPTVSTWRVITGYSRRRPTRTTSSGSARDFLGSWW